ncbi:MAG: hypothetical protein AVDCRST_MAG61-198 [uncultured Friedmanniella sp.]|uniref:Uncharacterized protein n=1 Tax=uncultured Friedmanniella sp. TaxID=335381 RepID=A0A6J4JZH7_9ACTN|nr:hypothetical protein [uncultured Friedmanniella sp.]CAA9291399.1 MAG: hypothetical protein AVDCRST_MAG61-198 [uncultured Friedmanniella sp.]
MTVESPAGPATQPAEPSIHMLRARRLLVGGFVGGAVAAVLSLLVGGIVHGIEGVLSAAVAAALVLFFYGVGQYVMVRSADAGARTLMAVSLVSYTTRVAILGLVLWVFDTYADAWSTMIPMVLFLTTVAVVVGWLAAEIWTFARLRIGVYDTEYVPPSGTGGAA